MAARPAGWLLPLALFCAALVPGAAVAEGIAISAYAASRGLSVTVGADAITLRWRRRPGVVEQVLEVTSEEGRYLRDVLSPDETEWVDPMPIPGQQNRYRLTGFDAAGEAVFEISASGRFLRHDVEHDDEGT